MAEAAHVSAVLSARSYSADLTQDDPDALLVLQRAETPAPLETPAAHGGPLPARHPICQLVRAAVWRLSYPPCAT